MTKTIKKPISDDTILHDAWRFNEDMSEDNRKPTYTTSVNKLGEVPFSPWWDDLPKKVILWFNDTKFAQVFRYEHNMKSPMGKKVKLYIRNK